MVARILASHQYGWSCSAAELPGRTLQPLDRSCRLVHYYPHHRSQFSLAGWIFCSPDHHFAYRRIDLTLFSKSKVPFPEHSLGPTLRFVLTTSCSTVYFNWGSWTWSRSLVSRCSDCLQIPYLPPGLRNSGCCSQSLTSWKDHPICHSRH